MKQVQAYQINEHPNPQKVYEWIRHNWHDLSQHNVDEAIESLKALARHLNSEVDYSISAVPDQGEYILFGQHDCDVRGTIKEYKHSNLMPDLSGCCPLTGAYWDEILLDAFRNISPITEVSACLNDAGDKLLKAIHKETDYQYSDKGLKEFCIANEYHFFDDGRIV